MAPVQAKTNFWNINIMGVVNIAVVVVSFLVFILTVKAQVDENAKYIDKQEPILAELAAAVNNLTNEVGQLKALRIDQNQRLDRLETSVHKHHEADKIKSYEDVLRLYNNRSK